MFSRIHQWRHLSLELSFCGDIYTISIYFIGNKADYQDNHVFLNDLWPSLSFKEFHLGWFSRVSFQCSLLRESVKLFWVLALWTIACNHCKAVNLGNCRTIFIVLHFLIFIIMKTVISYILSAFLLVQVNIVLVTPSCLEENITINFELHQKIKYWSIDVFRSWYDDGYVFKQVNNWIQMIDMQVLT